MICPYCVRENPASLRFCHHCGRALGYACPACGFENSTESNFCGGCGGRLAEVQPEDALGERRQLTVLFCDIVGSTRLSEILDPEDFGPVLAEYQRICGAAAEAHGGYISKYLGDGVVMYFGYPRAAEDEPRRAVRAGLDIIARVQALGQSRRFPADASLAVRLGAHTGRVVVGTVGTGRDRFAFGSTPNVAARIETAAEPGWLVVSEATWRLVRGHFHGESLGSSALKGVAEPVELWRVTGEDESGDRQEIAGDLTPFVGRRQERAMLCDDWSQVVAGVSRFALLRGEPGVGKSRLARRFIDDVPGAHLVEMRCTSYATHSPFQPVIHLMERRFGLGPGLDPGPRGRRLRAELERLGLTDPEGMALIGSVLAASVDSCDEPGDLSPVRRRVRTLELLGELIVALTGGVPTLLLVEDLHWADSSTLELVDLLVETAPAVPLMVLLTARPELDLKPDGPLRIVELSPFDRADAEALVRGVALGKPLPGEVTVQIVARSDGVPLFVEELTRSVLESGIVKERDVAWEAVDVLSEAMLPATVDASLMSRIDQLGPSRATAQLAATVGRDFTAVLLGRVSERDDATLAFDLERMVQSGLVRPREGESGTFEFRHALIRDSAYNSLLRSTRVVHHRRIADALRAAPEEHAPARPDLIARHLTAAGEDAEAVPFWQTAAAQALERTAVHVAASHLQSAIGCLSRLPATDETAGQELELQLQLAPLLMTVHGWGAVEVEHACQRALDLATGLGRYDRCYPPMWGLWTVRYLRAELHEATAAAEGVLGMARASGMAMLEVTGRHALSFTLLSRGQYRGALAEADAGIALFDFAQEQQLAIAFGLSSTVALRASRAASLWMLGHVVEFEQELARMDTLARRLAHPPSLAAALAFALYSEACRYSYLGEMECLAGRVAELAELSRDDDFFLWHAMASTFGAIVAHGRGEHDAGRRMLDGLALWEQAGARLMLAMTNVFCAEAFLRSGEVGDADRRLAVAAAATGGGDGMMAPEIARVRGRVLAATADAGGAEASYRAALEQSRAQDAVPLELRAALDLHELLAASGRAGDAHGPLAAALERCPERLDAPEATRAAVVLAGLALPAT